MIFDVARYYLWLFTLYINIKIGKKMLNVRQAGDHLYGKSLFTWVACDVYDGVFLCCPFSPRGVLGELLNLIESVSGGFLSFS